MDSKNTEEVKEVRYCKKCGCELASSNKRKLCENCRRSRNANIRAVGTSFLLAIGVTSLAALNRSGQLSDSISKNDDDDNDDNDNSDREKDHAL